VSSSSALGLPDKPTYDNRYGIRSPNPERGRGLDPYDDGLVKTRKNYGSAYNKDRDISVALKIELAKRQAKNPEYADNLRESAYLLEDMTSALEKGRTKMSPRHSSPPRALNRLMELKLEKQQKELTQKLEREAKHARR
jgi:hypothetical protein